jgi:hypothetical protein
VTPIVAALAAAAVLTAPPLPVLRSHGERLTAARGSYCWAIPPGPDGYAEEECGGISVPPVTKRSLRVARGGRVRVAMHVETDSLRADLGGRTKRLRVSRVRGSKRRFVVRLPRRMKQRPVLNLFATYPQGDGTFGARLRVNRPR